MVRVLVMWRRDVRVSILLLAVALAVGCSATSVRRDLDLAEPRSGTANAGDLMSAHDHEALAGLAATRAREGREGYRIGPDDLLDLRIPK